MGIFKKLFGSKIPLLKKVDITNFTKVAELVNWFIENDKLVTIKNPSLNILFAEGYKLKSGIKKEPETFNPNIRTLKDWFITKIFLDLNILKDASKEEFMKFIDELDEISSKALMAVGNIAMKYNINFKEFIYNREIEKIPKGIELESFKLNFFTGSIIASETRILGWLYHNFFGEWYEPKLLRNI